jgi:hypothetical protein
METKGFTETPATTDNTALCLGPRCQMLFHMFLSPSRQHDNSPRPLPSQIFAIHFSPISTEKQGFAYIKQNNLQSNPDMLIPNLDANWPKQLICRSQRERTKGALSEFMCLAHRLK